MAAQSVLDLIIRSRKTGTGAKDAGKELGGLQSAAVKAAKAIGAAFLAIRFSEILKESTLLAARFETMGLVLENLAPRAGLTASQMRKLEDSLRDTGISMLGVREIIPQLISAEIDLANATDLARIAQDGAVIAGVNSTESFKRLTTAITTGQVETLRSLNLFVDFEGALRSYAASLGKPVDALTELERVQGRTNAVLAAGGQIAGTYEAAMESAGKQLGSFERDVEDFQVTLGLFTQAILEGAVPALREWTQAATDAMQVGLDLIDAEQRLGSAFDETANVIQRHAGAAYVENKEEVIALSERVRELAEAYRTMAESVRATEPPLSRNNILLDEFHGIRTATLAVTGAEDAFKTLDGVLARLQAIQRGATARVLVQQFHEQGPGGGQAVELDPGAERLRQLAEGSFQGGGVVPGPVGVPRRAIVHGGEVITDPQFGQQPPGGGQIVMYNTFNDRFDREQFLTELSRTLRHRPRS
jgi:hypothetical protein